jgi:hypothetical protein
MMGRKCIRFVGLLQEPLPESTPPEGPKLSSALRLSCDRRKSWLGSSECIYNWKVECVDDLLP